MKYAQLNQQQQEVVNKELVARSTSGSEVISTEAGIFVIDKRTNTARQVTVAPGTQPIPAANQTVTSTQPAPSTQNVPSVGAPDNTAETTRGVSRLPPGAPLPGKELPRPTEDQAKSLNFATRANATNSTISALEERGVTGTSTTLAALESLSRTNPAVATGIGAGVGIASKLGVIGGIVGIVTSPYVITGSGIALGSVLLAEPVANMLRTPEQQQYFQAKADFIGSVLRKESGAAISTAEYEREEARYFPRAGDTIEVMLQKAKARDRVIATLEKESGMKLPIPASADASSYVKRSVGFYREQFKGMDADAAQSYLITRYYNGTDEQMMNAGTLAYQQVFNTAPKYVAYGAKQLPEDLVPLTPVARMDLMNKIHNTWTIPFSVSQELDGWLIALNGISENQLHEFSIAQRAAIRKRMKALDLPRKSE